MAPEMPQAMYSLGPTVLPVWPTWWLWAIHPESTAAREAPTTPPSTSARAFTGSKPSGPPTPRPPDTMISAPSRSTFSVSASLISSSTWVRMSLASTWMSSLTTSALASPGSLFLNTPGRTVPIWGR